MTTWHCGARSCRCWEGRRAAAKVKPACRATPANPMWQHPLPSMQPYSPTATHQSHPRPFPSVPLPFPSHTPFPSLRSPFPPSNPFPSRLLPLPISTITPFPSPTPTPHLVQRAGKEVHGVALGHQLRRNGVVKLLGLAVVGCGILDQVLVRPEGGRGGWGGKGGWG